MGKRHWTPAALGLVLFVPALLHAQTELSNPLEPKVAQQLGGQSSVDLITLRAGTPSIPLRHGSVISGSEQVQLNGRSLRRGSDYTVDLEAGVIYLMVTAVAGQSVVVTYRYDASRAQAGVSAPVAGTTPFRLSFGGGNSMGLTLGMGLTERTADGSVLTNNIFGWNNAFSLGGSKLNGLMLFGDRSQEQARSLMGYQASTVAPGQGRSKLVMESLGGDVAGGSFQLDYQDVSKNFIGFSAVQSNGYDSSVADRLAKERGLTRMGFAMNNLKLGGLGFSQNYRTVGDGKNSVTWRSFGMDSGALSLKWHSQDVGKGFNRFKDLAETDRDQLAREAGLSREGWDGSLKSSLGLLSYTDSSVRDGNGRGITRDEVKLDGSKIKFLMGEQNVQTGFNRFDSLFEPEKAQWSRESGLRRQWQSLDTALFGSLDHPLHLATYRIDSKSGDMANVDASVGGKAWSFEHIQRKVDSGFAALPSLTAQEMDANISAISNMYVKGGIPVRPEERNWYLRSPGLDREFTRFTVAPFTGWNASFSNLKLVGKQDEAKADDFTLSGRGLNVTWKNQQFGSKFTELGSMMEFERQRLGTMSGLSRSDFGLTASLKGSSKVSLSQTRAQTANGGMQRQALAYTDRNLQINVNTREVDPNFTAVNQLLDPEAPQLAQMVGFKEADAQIKWQILPNLRVEAMNWNGYDAAHKVKRNASNLLLDWAPNRATQLQYVKTGADSDNPLSTLFATSLKRLSLVENMGRYGTIRYLNQEVTFSGSQASQPGSNLTDVSYETKLGDKTSVKTEQVSTTFENGDTEKVNSNTVNTELGKKAGLSLTDIAIDRSGDNKDERKRNLGFWVSLWNGVRLNLGVVDNLNDLGSSTTQHSVSLTPGTIGAWQIASASYNANAWDQTGRTQAASAISISTAKPFTLGALKDVKIGLGQDTAADNGAWLRENKTASFSARLGMNTFGYDYRSQINNLQQRAADRTFSLQTDPSETSNLRATATYKLRTLPGDQQVAIRNFSVTARPIKGMELTNQMLTNPEMPRGDVLLGSMWQPVRVNKWKLDYLKDPNFKIAGSWEEQRNDDSNALYRLGGVTMTFFEKLGSPLTLFLGSEQAGGNVPRRSSNRWSLRYDQRPGPNQFFSLFVGNVTYGGTIADGVKRSNLSVDLEYQFKF